MSLGWTQEQDDQVVALWEAGRSAGEIAARIKDKTRSAILGRLHRLRGGVKRAEPRTLRRATGPTQPKRPRAQRPPRASTRLKPPQALTRILEPTAPPVVILKGHEVEPNGTPVGLFELCAAACKWPVTSDSPFMFCNRVRRGDSSYCDEHTMKSYQPPKQKFLEAAE